MNDPEVIRLAYWPDSRPYYAALRELAWPVWLDSGFPQSGGGRFDIIAADPFVRLTSRGGVTTVERCDAPDIVSRAEPLQLLREQLGGEPVAPVSGLPFNGGAIGFLGYDLERARCGLAPRAGLEDWPDMAVGLYDWAVIVDHERQRSHFCRAGRDRRRVDDWRSVLRRLQAVTPCAPAIDAADVELTDTGLSHDAYAGGFATIQRYIREGDCYQVNYAQRFRAVSRTDAWTLYQHMRSANPSPYGALLEYPFGQVLSSSPEQFLSLRGRRAQSRPIKGTRPRGATAEQDQRLRADLLSSEKDRAENVMIVDLLRNDLGKVCEPGSIEVPDLFRIESFATVHHLVSTVSGLLRRDRDALDLLEACFPGGSITGAPKRRAMQIIDELEAQPREVYCGSVIRLGFDGGLDSSITIRTVLKQGFDLHYWAGGGIVADSDCAAEYQESLDKAAAFLRLAAGPAGADG